MIIGNTEIGENGGPDLYEAGNYSWNQTPFLNDSSNQLRSSVYY